MLRKLLFIFVLAGLVGSSAPSCSVNYTFTGANIAQDVKTFTVYYFPNRARLVNPTLSQNFTEQMREKLTRQTSLNELSENGDLEFEGQITGYEFRPMSIQKEDVSAQTRLTITVKLKYVNSKHPEDNFEQTFSAYEDFDSSLSISSVEEELSVEIIEKLIEDIFNATIANW
ncbi:LptE family protein [Draconibacterium sp. IB214405]|uniref:LptE family protein n=1 Tax=Draconibacterium sp. IB214405 TaxID=3097352 RepID=UPI002A1633A3|nr:LptE family protein [Draconibacterium sp. IB214405]MDX8338532.1 LptE family protein [Draconibacterium sp. IB214405]